VVAAAMGRAGMRVGERVVGGSEAVELTDEREARAGRRAAEAALDAGQRQPGLWREAQFAHLLGDHGGGLAFVEAGLGVMQDRLAELDDLVAVAVDRLAHRLFQLFLGRHAAPRTSAPCPASVPSVRVFLAVIRGRRKTGRIGWP